jgi:hypothetical protein
MNLVNRRGFLSIFLIFAMAISGCGPEILIGPIVTGVIYWVNGEAHKYYESESDIVYRSTKHALRELDQEITRDTEKNGQYKIIAGNENRFSISIEKADKNITRLNIRINYIGDKDFAELIYKKVDEQINIIEFDPQGNPVNRHSNGRIHNRHNF